LQQWSLSFKFDEKACRELGELLEVPSLGALPPLGRGRIRGAPQSQLLDRLFKQIKEAYAIASYNGCILTKHLVFGVRWKKDEGTKLSVALALLRRVSLNPLLLMDSRITVHIPNAEETLPHSLSSLYSCDEVIGRPPSYSLFSSQSGLALLPHILRSNRMGISLGIACCQSLLALHVLGERRGGNNLAMAVAGTLINMAKVSTRPSAFTSEELTTATWAKSVQKKPECSLCPVDEISSHRNQEPDHFLNWLRENYGWVYSAIFGRIRALLDYNGNDLKEKMNAAAAFLKGHLEEEGVEAKRVILVMTEQTNILDLIIASRLVEEQIVVLYSPLTLASRLLLETLKKKHLRSNPAENNRESLPEVDFRFCPDTPPRILQALIRHYTKDGKDTIIIPGGSPSGYLAALANKRRSSHIHLCPLWSTLSSSRWKMGTPSCSIEKRS